MKIDIWGFFKILSRKFTLDQNQKKDNGYFSWGPVCIYDNISLDSS